ncbi:MAG: hypothetical protein AAFP77_29755 [Bacteroidota bacterium]
MKTILKLIGYALVGIIVLSVVANMCNRTNQSVIDKQEAAIMASIDQDSLFFAQMNETLSELENGFDREPYKGNTEAVAEGLNMLSKASGQIIKGEASEVEEISALAGNMKGLLPAAQKKAYPVLRKNFVEAIKHTYWRENVEVVLKGNRNTTIEFTGGAFANNATTEDTFKSLQPVLKRLRFKRANFKWYDYDDEYTYYTLDVLEDSEL